MTKVAIMPVPDGHGHVYFDAVAGERRARGMTAGAALDAMNEQLKSDESAAIIVLQNFRPDTFFSAAQQQRLEALMQRWRTARETGKALPQQEQDELEQLVEQELVASASRANRLSGELNK
ncbi:hypothetical protein HMY34_06150 [Thiothrix subterranea]|nr:hypothetical protein HMY34_06150 [Thiothrix subterranea]